MSAPAFHVVRGKMVREAEPTSRLEQLLARAESLGLCAGIVDSNGPTLVVSIFDGTRLLGHLYAYADETWRMESACTVMSGLPMQAGWLEEGAKRVRAAFDALVGAS